MKHGKPLRRGKPLQSSGFIKSKPHKATLWDRFRGQCAEAERDDDGYIWCAICQRPFESPDFHHILSKVSHPELYFARSNLIWLCRLCHREVHDGVYVIRPAVLEGQQPQISKVRHSDRINKVYASTGVRGIRVVTAEGNKTETVNIYDAGSGGNDYLLSIPPAGFGSLSDLGHTTESENI